MAETTAEKPKAKDAPKEAASVKSGKKAVIDNDGHQNTRNKQTSRNRNNTTLPNTSKISLARVRVKSLAVALMGLFVVSSVFLSGTQPARAAATSSNLNSQARLLNSSGSVVPDGNYNI